VTARGLLLSALLACVPVAASAAGRVLSATGALTTGDLVLKAGDVLPDAEVRLASGTATLALDGGRFLVTGPARFTPRKSYFRLDLGYLLSVLTHRAGRHFSVRTPTAVAAVRGTDFFVGVGPTQTVDVCICRGALEVSAKGMETLPLAAEHHLNYRFWPVKGGAAREKSPMLGHTDAELDVLRGLLAAEKP
jgi:ferric-dicitrate binding protein FerR (iron transport regulator)